MKRVALCVLVATAIVMMSPRDLTYSAEAADGGADPVAAAQIRPEDVSHVEELTVEQAEALVDQASRPDGPWLSFERLTTLSPEVAKKFAGHRGTISLRGLTTLSPELAEVIAGHRGMWLSLCGLTSLSPEVAEKLANHEGELDLSGLASLTSESAAILAKHANTLFLGGLKSLPTAAAEALENHYGPLPGLTRHD